MSGIPNCPDCGRPMVCFVPRNRYRCPECNTEYIRFLNDMNKNDKVNQEELRRIYPKFSIPRSSLGKVKKKW